MLALALIAAVGAVWWLSSANGAVQYTTAPVTTGAVTRMVTATGTVNPVLTIIVGTYVSGVIQDLSCDYNTKVKVGQVCAKIDPRPYQTVVDQNKANLNAAQAQLDKDKATLAYAQLFFDRMVGLAKTNAVSKDSLDNAKACSTRRARRSASTRPPSHSARRNSPPRKSTSTTPTSSRRSTAPSCRAM